MTRNRWGPRSGDGERIRRHLERQRDLDPLLFVRLDTYEIVRVGSDVDDDDSADSEDDHGSN